MAKLLLPIEFLLPSLVDNKGADDVKLSISIHSTTKICREKKITQTVHNCKKNCFQFNLFYSHQPSIPSKKNFVALIIFRSLLFVSHISLYHQIRSVSFPKLMNRKPSSISDKRLKVSSLIRRREKKAIEEMQKNGNACQTKKKVLKKKTLLSLYQS